MCKSLCVYALKWTNVSYISLLLLFIQVYEHVYEYVSEHLCGHLRKDLGANTVADTFANICKNEGLRAVQRW